MQNICRTHSNDPVVGGSGIRSNSSFPPADGDSILLLHGGLIQTTKVTIDNCLSHGHRQQLLMYTHVQIQRWRYQQIYFVISQTIDGAAIMKLPVGGLYSLYMNNQFDHHKWHILYTFNPGVRIYLFFMPNFYLSLLLIWIEPEVNLAAARWRTVSWSWNHYFFVFSLNVDLTQISHPRSYPILASTYVRSEDRWEFLPLVSGGAGSPLTEKFHDTGFANIH